MISVLGKPLLYHDKCSGYLCPKKASSFWSSVGFKIGAVTRFYFWGNLFLGGGDNREIRDTYAATKFPTYKVWWLREASQIGQMFIPMWKSRLKHSTAEFQSIQQFGLQLNIVSKKKQRNIKSADVRVRGNAREDQKPETFMEALHALL